MDSAYQKTLLDLIAAGQVTKDTTGRQLVNKDPLYRGITPQNCRRKINNVFEKIANGEITCKIAFW